MLVLVEVDTKNKNLPDLWDSAILYIVTKINRNICGLVKDISKQG